MIKKKDMKDIIESKMIDIAKGNVTTAFIFRKKNGYLHGFKVPTNKIEICSFNEINNKENGNK